MAISVHRACFGRLRHERLSEVTGSRELVRDGKISDRLLVCGALFGYRLSRRRTPRNGHITQKCVLYLGLKWKYQAK